MDPHLVAALLSAATTVFGGAGYARHWSAKRALGKRRASFVEGLPSFDRSRAQDDLASALSELGREREALASLSEATNALGLPDVPHDAPSPETALLDLADTYMHDARTSIALACGERDVLSLLADDPSIFAALRAEGERALAERPSLASSRSRVVAHRESTRKLLTRLEGRGGPRSGSAEDAATTMAHASALGALGAKVGAALGTLVLPGVGTLLGTAIGGIAVGVGGATAARELMRRDREAAHEELRRTESSSRARVLASAQQGLLNVARRSRESRLCLELARREAWAAPEDPDVLKTLVNDLLRALSWRLDEGASLLDSHGDLLRAGELPFLTKKARDHEEDLAQRALAAKRRSHARATEALKSALREDEKLRALGWVVALPLPSHREVDEIFEELTRVLTALVAEETHALTRRRAALAAAWVHASCMFFESLAAELGRHEEVRARAHREIASLAAD